jgi:hypothetical protein
MNIIPLISVKKGILLDGKDGGVLSLDDLFQRVEKDSMLYVLDSDGIEYNNPNLELYQKLTEQCILWIDAGPRRIDDVMDIIMAGATNLTLRNDNWSDMNLAEVFELTDDEVYLFFPSAHQESIRPFLQEVTGAVVFSDDIQRNSDLTTIGPLSNQAISQKIYLYDIPSSALTYWEERGISGALVDLQKKEGYR